MINPIDRGSFIITDAFAQALSFENLNITKCVPILMPIWSQTSGIFMQGQDVGLNNGTIDPNVLLANAMSRYFLNLTRHASKYKFDNSITSNENFAEQSFIKMMRRISVSNDFSTVTALPQSSNNNTLLMYSNAEDLLTRKITLHISALDKNVSPMLNNVKPYWLLTNELPVTPQPNMINSQEQAFYDAGMQQYNVSQNQCFKYNMVQGFDDVFSFNALLVYFQDLNGVEDLGGIYFLDRYQQVGTTHWEIPVVTKQTNSTFSYDINLISQGADILEWVTINGSLPAALTMYEDIFRDRAQLVQQNSSMLGAIQVLQSQMNGIQDLLATTDLSRFIALAQTLNLVDATDKTAILQAAVSLAFDNQLQEDFVVPMTVGLYQMGDVIPAGSDITVVLNNIFQ